MRRVSPETCGDLLKEDPHAPGGMRSPRAGELFYNPSLASTFKLLGEKGKQGFYEGRIAEAIVRAVRDRSGCLSHEDLREHGKDGSEFTKPISLHFRGQRVGQLGSGSRLNDQTPHHDESSTQKKRAFPDQEESLPESKRSRTETSLAENNAAASDIKQNPYSEKPFEGIEMIHRGGDPPKADNKTLQGVQGAHGESSASEEPSDGVQIWEHAPNGQGLVALLSLGILEELERSKRIPTFAPQDHNSVEYLHALIECVRLGFADARWYVADPSCAPAPLERLLSRQYLASRAALFNPEHAAPEPSPGTIEGYARSDTVYLAVTDRRGNAASFINSNFDDFGSGIVPEGCGFVLQNRGAGFALGPDGHPNLYAPRKRPYHTIIPALLTRPRDGRLLAALGVMGGFMQPQGHVQVLLNLLSAGMSPQAALDAPRFCVGPGMPHEGEKEEGTVVHLEEGFPEEVVQGLNDKGHKIKVVTGTERRLFGRGQVILCNEEEGRRVYSAGSDMRGDGAAFPA